jgi:dTDP-4-amino-4,6-dideoxygalactose transaminase
MGVPHDIHGALNQARRLADGEVSLPIHPQLTPSEIERVIAQVNAWVPEA